MNIKDRVTDKAVQSIMPDSLMREHVPNVCRLNYVVSNEEGGLSESGPISIPGYLKRLFFRT